MTKVDSGVTAFAGLMILGMASGLLSVVIFIRNSNPILMRRAVDRVLAHLLEFQLFSSEPALLLRAQRDLIVSNWRVLRLVLRPSLMLLVPFGILLGVVDTCFSHAPLRTGQPAIVTAQYRSDGIDLMAAHLKTPSGIEVDAGPVRVRRDRQVSWRIRAVRQAAGNLEISSPGSAVRKTITAQPGWQWISENRSRFPQFLIHPSELPIIGSALESISVFYPEATVFNMPPLVWFALGSMAGALVACRSEFVSLFEGPLPYGHGSVSSMGRTSMNARCTGFPAQKFTVACFVLVVGSVARGDTTSPLFARGYTVLPQPQQVLLRGGDFEFRSLEWTLRKGSAIPGDSEAVESLTQGLQERFGKSLGPGQGQDRKLVLDLLPGSVKPGTSQDSDRRSIEQQAYRLTLSASNIQITANAPLGLFYGVQTLLQLLKQRGAALFLPEAEITDWPDLGLRQIYWDNAHHLERISAMEAAIREAAFFKINGLAIKLEGHFQYKSAPAITEPQALSPAELQHLTDYGMRRHVQIIPYLDSPAHIAFILKHPEYARLRAFPDSNYELCTTNPDASRLLRGMYDDLLAANKGVHYVYLSTDEAYYVGQAQNAQCSEMPRAKQLGSRGKLLAEFVSGMAEYLHQQGREVIFWGEYPLKPEDIGALPSFLINGETYGEKFDRVYRSHGMRQMIYSSVEGEEKLFPHYFLLPHSRRIHQTEEDFPRISDALEKMGADSARHNSNLIGLTVAAWADMGLHNETFWMGYATAASGGWRSFSAGADEAMSSFYPLWYGTGANAMNRVYQLMSFQAQIWADTWESVDSKARVGIWGNSEKIFAPRQPAHDASISLPPIPDGDLTYRSSWEQENLRRLTLASDAVAENDELLGLLNENIRQVQRHREGLTVFLSIARLCRENLEFLNAWERIDDLLKQASGLARKEAAARALRLVDESLSLVRKLKTERNIVLRNADVAWQWTWLPRAVDANGRHYFHQVDDVKDHLPDRTTDMSYLVYRELLLPVEDWYRHTQTARNAYARAHQEPEQNIALVWGSLD